MATNLIKMQIQFRRDTFENWELHRDVIPAEGEPCFIIDKNILKIGDGKKHFWELDPINGVKLELAGDGKSIVLEDNILKLMGFDGAEAGAHLVKGEDGKIKWEVPSTEIIDGLQTDVAELKTGVSNLNAEVAGLKINVDGLQTDIADLKVLVGSSDNGTGTLLSRIEGLEKEVNTIVNGLTPDDGKIDSLIELINYVDTHGKKTAQIVSDITSLQELVGSDPVKDQISAAIANSGHMSKTEAEDTLLSKVEARATYEKVKYEIINTPVGTLVDYRDKEIRVMVPAGAEFVKQNVGVGGDTNTYYATFKTYAPDNAVGYIEHMGNQVDKEILTDLKIDSYGRKYQPTWLGLAKYSDASGWTYYGKNSTAKRYIGWDYQIDWYDANGVVISSDKIRINLSNEECHHIIEPFYMANVVREVSVNGTLLDIINGKVDITIPEFKNSDEITVNKDGTFSINTISFDKIVQNPETVLVMDGGSAV